MMTLQCVGSVRAVLTPENGMAVMGQCTTPSGNSATLCDPTKLFPQPLFDQIPGGRVSLKIIGYKDANCASQLFETHTGVFDVATAASMSTPVTMMASCSASDGMLCDQVLNVQGNIVGWPPNMQRDPPNITGVNYQVGFGYVAPGSGDTQPVFRKLFDVTYNPLPTAGHSLTGIGTLPQSLGTTQCIGYQATAIPAQGITTLTCFDPALLVGTVQPLDAYYVSLNVAGAAQLVWGTNGGGVLLGQVTKDGIGLQNAIVSGTDVATGPLSSSRLLYFDYNMQQFTNRTATDASGVFVVLADSNGGAAIIRDLQAVAPGVGSTPTAPAQIILPRQATILDLKL